MFYFLFLFSYHLVNYTKLMCLPRIISPKNVNCDCLMLFRICLFLLLLRFVILSLLLLHFISSHFLYTYISHAFILIIFVLKLHSLPYVKHFKGNTSIITVFCFTFNTSISLSGLSLWNVAFVSPILESVSVFFYFSFILFGFVRKRKKSSLK